MSKQPFRAVTLPVGWPKKACDAAVKAMGLAHVALTQVRGWCADSRIARVRLAAKLERAEAEVALLREELRIKDARMTKLAPRERPHYAPPDRLAILQLRAARGWTLELTAARFWSLW